jgi:hypothetical protein
VVLSSVVSDVFMAKNYSLRSEGVQAIFLALQLASGFEDMIFETDANYRDSDTR